MAYFAEINEENVVVRVLVTDDNDPAGDAGYSWLIENVGGTWLKTSYEATSRKNFAGIGFSYDEELDAFIPPKPFESWILDEETCTWVPPLGRPNDGQKYSWDEGVVNWKLIEIEEN